MTPARVIERGAVVVAGAAIAWVGHVADARGAGWGDVVASAGPGDGATVLLARSTCTVMGAGVPASRTPLTPR